MKRMHVHISVDDLSKSIQFYNHLFGAVPSVEKQDYAKWMLEDPRMNFAISQRGERPGLNHLGIQVEDDSELGEIKQRLEAADLSMLIQEGTTCCYAKSDKHWVQDPSGIAWESYRTLDSAPTFSASAPTFSASADDHAEAACCSPVAETIAFVARKTGSCK